MYANPTLPISEAALPQSKDERFAEFVSLHREKAVRTAWRLTSADRATAEEVAQDAFLKAHKALDRFRDDASLSTWFYRILVRQAANHRRWRSVRERFALTQRKTMDSVRQPTSTDPGLRRQIDGAMNALSHKQKSVFVLVYLEGFTVDEAAHFVGCAKGTARSHLHRALKHLRHTLAPLHQEVQS